MIDAKNVLSNKHIMEFIKDISEDSIVSIKINNSENLIICNLKDLKDTFKKISLDYNLKEEDLIVMNLNLNKIEFLGLDLKKWTEDTTVNKYGKLNKLFKESKVKELKEEQIFNICCGILENNKVENVTNFRGNLKETLEYVNKTYAINEVIGGFQNKTVFCLEKDFSDLKNWKTLPQLIEEDIFEI